MVVEEEKIKLKKEEKMRGETRAELRGFYAVWYREIVKYLNDRPRAFAAIFTPLIWLALFGVGFSSFFSQEGFNYIDFVFPGIIAQTILFTSLYLGTSITVDRQFGYLKEILVSPIRRISIFSGKMLGGATDAIIQGTIVLALSFVFGIGISPQVFLACLPIMILTAFIIVSMSLTIATRITSFASFSFVMTLIVLPLFFSSGALFPISTTPEWLPILVYIASGGSVLLPINTMPVWFQILSTINPLTYATDALRGLVLGHTLVSFNPMTFQYDLIRTLLFGNNVFPLWLDMAVLGGFALGMIALGVYTFGIRK
jgi:ABC-2 type transport system permease protein